MIRPSKANDIREYPQIVATYPQPWFCVRGSSGGLPMGSRRCGASEEAATKEQTPEPPPHPAKQGSHSG